MVIKEAIRTLKDLRIFDDDCETDCEAIDIAIEALEKQEPKFVKCPKGWHGTRYTRYHCPDCNRVLRMDEEWCNNCGQHLKQPKRKLVDNEWELDWSEDEIN